MGKRIPPPFIPSPVPPGVNCPNGWGIGKPFGDVDTPSSIWLQLTGIAKGPNWVASDGLPPNGTFQLLQQSPAVCTFFDVHDGNNMLLNFREFEIEVIVNGAPSPQIFNDEFISYSTLIGANTVTSHFKNGQALVIIPGTT